MFYHLFYPLASEIGAFNVFRYITFRTGAATLTALFISFLVGPALIRTLGRLRWCRCCSGRISTTASSGSCWA